MNRFTAVAVSMFFAFTAVVSVPVLHAQQGAPANNVQAAYVDIQKVLQSDPSYKQAIKDLKEYKKNLESRIKKQQKELQKMRKNLQQQGSLLSNKQRQKKRKELQAKMRKLQQRARRSQQLMQQKKQELLQPILKKLNPIVKSVAQERGFNVIYSYGQQGNQSVLWVSDQLNITQAVINRLNQQ